MASKKKASVSCVIFVIIGIILLNVIWVPKYECDHDNQILYTLKVFRAGRPSEITSYTTACCGTANGGCKGVDWVPDVCYRCNCNTGCCEGKWGRNCSVMWGQCQSHTTKVLLLEKLDDTMQIWGIPVDFMSVFSPKKTIYSTIIFNKTNDNWNFIHDGISNSWETGWGGGYVPGPRPQERGYISPTKINWNGHIWNIHKTTAQKRCTSGCLKFSNIFSPPRSIELTRGNHTIASYNKVSFGLETYESLEEFRGYGRDYYSICIDSSFTPFQAELAIAAMNITMSNYDS
jgi:hypothetical protein